MSNDIDIIKTLKRNFISDIMSYGVQYDTTLKISAALETAIEAIAAPSAASGAASEHAKNCATNLDGDMRGACDCSVTSGAPELLPMPQEFRALSRIDSDYYLQPYVHDHVWQVMRAYGQACAAAERASGVNAQLVAALQKMVSWFGRYPEFVPASETADNIKAAIKASRAAITAAGVEVKA